MKKDCGKRVVTKTKRIEVTYAHTHTYLCEKKKARIELARTKVEL